MIAAKLDAKLVEPVDKWVEDSTIESRRSIEKEKKNFFPNFPQPSLLSHKHESFIKSLLIAFSTSRVIFSV